jgi:surfactin synthase thioesterase subunit
MGALLAVRVSSLISPPSGVILSSVVLAGRCPPFQSFVQINHQEQERNNLNSNARGVRGDEVKEEASSIEVSSAELDEDIKKYNLASEEVTKSSAWRDHFLPLLLGDLAMDRRLSFTQLHVPKNMEVNVCCGMSDLSFPHEKTIEWSRVGGASLSVTLMEGGHEFLNEQVDRLLNVCLTRSSGDLRGSSSSGGSNNCVSGSGTEVRRRKEITPLYRVVWDPSGVVEGEEKSKGVEGVDAVLDLVLHGTSMRRADDGTVVDLTSSPQLFLEKKIVVLRLLGCSSGCSGEKYTKYYVDQSWLFVQLMQAMMEESDSTTWHVVIVSDDMTNGVYGASRTVGLEFPEMSFQRIALLQMDGEEMKKEVEGGEEACTTMAPTARTIRQDLLLRVAQQYSNESDLEYNVDTGIVHLRRLDPIRFPSSSSTRRQERRVLHEDGLHLVTGGTGGIGTELVQWLVNVQGVQPHDIILLTRKSGPHPMQKK